MIPAEHSAIVRGWESLRCKIRYRTLVRAKSSNFRRLVLVSIEADFCIQTLIFQHFSRSTRFAILCTAPNQINSEIFFNIFCGFVIFCKILRTFCKFLLEFVDFRVDFYRNFTKFCRINQNYQISAENCEHCEISTKFGQHFCENACVFHVTPTTRRGRFRW